MSLHALDIYTALLLSPFSRLMTAMLVFVAGHCCCHSGTFGEIYSYSFKAYVISTVVLDILFKLCNELLHGDAFQVLLDFNFMYLMCV